MTLIDLYRITCVKALNRTRTVKAAALLMGVTERTVYNWMKEYGIIELSDGKYKATK